MSTKVNNAILDLVNRTDDLLLAFQTASWNQIFGAMHGLSGTSEMVQLYGFQARKRCSSSSRIAGGSVAKRSFLKRNPVASNVIFPTLTSNIPATPDTFWLWVGILGTSLFPDWLIVALRNNPI